MRTIITKHNRIRYIVRIYKFDDLYNYFKYLLYYLASSDLGAKNKKKLNK